LACPEGPGGMVGGYPTAVLHLNESAVHRVILEFYAERCNPGVQVRDFLHARCVFLRA
jgi:hypothetical protein